MYCRWIKAFLGGVAALEVHEEYGDRRGSANSHW